MAKRKAQPWKIKCPTSRKLRNRGYQAVRYRGPHEVVHGWIIEERGNATRLFIAGGGVRWVRGPDRRYITPYDNRIDQRADAQKGA